MIDKVFDLDRWMTLFPDKGMDINDLAALPIGSPSTVVELTYLRKMFLEKPFMRQRQLLPTDVLVPVLGEPQFPCASKIGGAAYWPQGVAWPRQHGKNLRFFAQFNFSFSTDILPALPGNLLVIFCTEGVPAFDNPDFFRFCWFNTKDVKELLSAIDQMTVSVPLSPQYARLVCHAERHRSYDIQLSSSDTGRAERFLEDNSDYLSITSVLTIEGWKIGGKPLLADPESNTRDFLCSLGSIVPKRDQVFPWVNRPSPYDGENVLEAFDKEEVLYFYDGFLLDFFLEKDGGIAWQLHLR